MSELVSVVVTILAYTLVLVVKPEWLIGWLLNLMKKKMPLKKANDTTNALGIKAIEVGTYMIEGIADTNEKVNAKVQEIKNALEELRKELFPLS
jgi:hypothetical protein